MTTKKSFEQIHTIEKLAIDLFNTEGWFGRTSAVKLAKHPEIMNPSSSFVQRIAEDAINRLVEEKNSKD